MRSKNPKTTMSWELWEAPRAGKLRLARITTAGITNYDINKNIKNIQQLLSAVSPPYCFIPLSA